MRSRNLSLSLMISSKPGMDFIMFMAMGLLSSAWRDCSIFSGSPRNSFIIGAVEELLHGRLVLGRVRGHAGHAAQAAHHVAHAAHRRRRGGRVVAAEQRVVVVLGAAAVAQGFDLCRCVYCRGGAYQCEECELHRFGVAMQVAAWSCCSLLQHRSGARWWQGALWRSLALCLGLSTVAGSRLRLEFRRDTWHCSLGFFAC